MSVDVYTFNRTCRYLDTGNMYMYMCMQSRSAGTEILECHRTTLNKRKGQWNEA